MVKKAVQRGRSKRGGEAYSVRYVEPPSAARTKLADFFNILLGANIDSNEATESETWTLLAITEATVPVGTRSIEFILLGEKGAAGSFTDAGVDDVGARLILPW